MRRGELRATGIGKRFRLRATADAAEERDLVEDGTADSDDGGLFSFFTAKVEDIWALRDVSFHIEPGERVAIIGENGSGKSTLMRILSRTLPPSQGEIEGAGIVIPFRALRAPLNQRMSGCDNLRLMGQLLGIPSDHLEERLPDIVAFSELGSLAYKSIANYSDRSFTRLSASMGLFIDADIYLIDDNLKIGDEVFNIKFQDKFAEITRRRPTIIYASNALSRVRSVCERAIWLSGGRVVSDGEVSSVVGSFFAVSSELVEFSDLARDKPRSVDEQTELSSELGHRVTVSPKNLTPMKDWARAVIDAERSWDAVLRRRRDRLKATDLTNFGSISGNEKCSLARLQSMCCLDSLAQPVRRFLPGEELHIELQVEALQPDVRISVRLEVDVNLSLVLVAEPLVPFTASAPGHYLFAAALPGDLFAQSFDTSLYKFRARVLFENIDGQKQEMAAATVWCDLRGDVRVAFDEERFRNGHPPTGLMRPAPAYIASADEIEGYGQEVSGEAVKTRWERLNRKPALRPRLRWMVYQISEEAAGEGESSLEGASGTGTGGTT